VYFPHGGILSCVVEAETGWGIETGMIGYDGIFGAGQAIDHGVSLNKVVVQIAGPASVVSGKAISDLAGTSAGFRDLVARFEHFMLAQSQQSATCNAVHNVEQRMCEWLVRMYDLAGAELPLTQEFLAQMMGVRRTSVTVVAGEMQKKGMISYHRGKLRILDIDLICKNGCECAETARQHYDRMFGTSGGSPASYKPTGTRPSNTKDTAC